MLADSLDAPFRRNQPIRFERSITHGHFLSPRGLGNVVVVWRDPRDLLVSFYYHCYFVNEHANKGLVALMKAHCPFEDYSDIRANLPAFIRFVTKTPVSPSFSWVQFAQVWADRDHVVHTSYEALRADTTKELRRIVEALSGQKISMERAKEVAEAHSFDRAKAIAERSRPEVAEMSFVREGSVGGWRKHFTVEAEEALGTLGYEKWLRGFGYSKSDEPLTEFGH